MGGRSTKLANADNTKGQEVVPKGSPEDTVFIVTYVGIAATTCCSWMLVKRDLWSWDPTEMRLRMETNS